MKAARGLLEWTQSNLADASGISLTAINSIERGAVTPRKSNLAKIQAAFEDQGIEFTNGDAPGVRLRK